MSEIDPKLVERMVALVRDLHADHVRHGALDIVQDFVSRTAAIVAELPAPVDPDLIAVRKAVGDAVPAMKRGEKNILAGDYDDTVSITVPLAMLKLGRELAREQGA